MRLRYFLRLMEAAMLAEASKYDPMFAEIIRIIPPEYRLKLVATINWARQTLQREDRIVWFLRWYRLIYLHQVIDATNTPGFTPEREQQLINQGRDQFRTQAQALLAKYSAQLGNIMGRQLTTVDFNTMAPLRSIQNYLGHILSLPVPAIQNYQFSKETPRELENALNILETQWKQEQEERAEHLQPEEEDQILIQFPDGWAWWLLDRGSCSAEAAAMGHCGNVPSEEEGDRLLSLRKQTQYGWRPSLTFILNADGKLGEMKGRGNDKPAPQYHPYIVKLLENPIIQGIRGGGYMPKHNFALSDLSPEEQERLAEINPNLASGSYLLKKYGPTDQFGNKVVEEIDNALEEYGRDRVKWDSESKLFIIEVFLTVDDFIKEYGSDFLKRVANNFNGNGESFFDDMMDGVDSSSMKDLYEELPPEVLQRIATYTHSTYAESYPDTDFADPDEVWEILDDENDDILDGLKYAVETGLRYGAESDMHDAFVKVLRDGWGSTDANYLTMHYTMYTAEDGKEHIQMDSACSMTISPQDAAQLLDSGAIDDIATNGWTQGDVLEIEEPRYGWSGYDESAAKEDAVDQLEMHSPQLFEPIPQPVHPAQATLL